jgi:hypothetical protein
MAAQKSTTIHVVPEHETAEQIRDEIRSNHPLLAAIADQIQTMVVVLQETQPLA